jgi:YVTN family beta-propeller protein
MEISDKRRSQMTLEKIFIRRVVLLGAFVIITRLAAAQTRSPLLLVAVRSELDSQGQSRAGAKNVDGLVIFDPLAGKVIGRVPTGGQPHNVAASADGKLAFVTNRTGGSISVIDVATRKELRRVNLGPGSEPHGIVFAGGKVYFTARGKKVIGCYDPASNQIVDWLLGSAQNIQNGRLVVTKDLNKIFTDNSDSDNITAFERVSDPRGGAAWNLTAIPIGKKPKDSDRPHGIDISPDGKELWTASMGGGVSIIDVATLKVTRTLNVPGTFFNRLKFTPDGKLVLISNLANKNKNGELVVLDAVARKEIKRLKLDGDQEDILVVPDGSRAYVSLSVTNSVANIDLKTLEVTGSIHTGPSPKGLAWAVRR